MDTLKPITEKLTIFKKISNQTGKKVSPEQTLIGLSLLSLILIYVLPIGSLLSTLILITMGINIKNTNVYWECMVLCSIIECLNVVMIIPFYYVMKSIFFVVLSVNNDLYGIVEHFVNECNLRIKNCLGKESIMEKAKEAVENVKGKYEKGFNRIVDEKKE